MSILSKKLASNNRKASGFVRPAEGNIILRPSTIAKEGVTGEILAGLGIGQTITVAYSGDPENKVGYAELTKASNKSYIDIAAGGTLQIEGVARAEDGTYTCTWMRSFKGQPAADDNMLADAMATFTFARRKNGIFADAIVLNSDEEVIIEKVEDLVPAMAKMMSEHQRFMIFHVEDGVPYDTPMNLSGKKVDGSDEFIPNDPLEQAEKFVADLNEEEIGVLTKAIERKEVAIVPLKRFGIKGVTLETILDSLAAGKMPTPININVRIPPSLPRRLMNQLLATDNNDKPIVPDEVLNRLQSALMAYLPKDEAGAFSSEKRVYNWASVSTESLEGFLKAHNVPFKEYKSRAYSRQALLVKGEDLDQPHRCIATKSFTLSRPTPLPALKVFEAAREAYFNEPAEIIAALDEALRVGLGAKRETADVKAAAIDKHLDAPEAGDLSDELPMEMDDGDLGSLLDGLAHEIGGEEDHSQEPSA